MILIFHSYIHMKRITLFLLLCAFSYIVKAQDHFDARKFEANLEAYISKEAHLTEAEAGKLFPLYRQMQSQKRNLHNQLHQLRKVKPSSEKEAERLIAKCDNIDIEIRQIEKQYHLKMQKVVNARKLYDVIQAERRFHRMALKKQTNKSSKR